MRLQETLPSETHAGSSDRSLVDALAAGTGKSKPVRGSSPAGPRSGTLRTGLILVLTLLGTSGVVARWAGIPALPEIGALLLWAPQPAVFSDRNISSELTFGLQLKNGAIQRRRVDREAMARLGGPLARTDAYVHAILAAGDLPLPLWRQVLTFGICESGPLARAMGIEEAVTKAMIRIEFRSRPQAWPRAVRVFCRPSPDVAIDQW